MHALLCLAYVAMIHNSRHFNCFTDFMAATVFRGPAVQFFVSDYSFKVLFILLTNVLFSLSLIEFTDSLVEAFSLLFMLLFMLVVYTCLKIFKVTQSEFFWE